MLKKLLFLLKKSIFSNLPNERIERRNKLLIKRFLQKYNLSFSDLIWNQTQKTISKIDEKQSKNLEILLNNK